MIMVFVHGPPACGKLTIARELSTLTGFRVFHNHLTVDLATALFDFGTEQFVQLREWIWLHSFSEAAQADQSFIFTFAPESTVRDHFIGDAVAAIDRAGGTVAFVELTCQEDELERRMENDDRAAFGKLNSADLYRELRDSGTFSGSTMPEPIARVDTTAIPPTEAAATIAAALART